MRDALETYYDRYGGAQDSQAYYEDPAFAWLIGEAFYGEYADDVHLAEFGCGTGRFAAQVASRLDAGQLRYSGFDISQTMVDLTRAALGGVDGAQVRKSDGGVELPLGDESTTHFAANFVLDLLSPDAQFGLLEEAHRVLVPGGRLMLASLDKDAAGLARVTSLAWRAVHAVFPLRVGGCRPISLADLVKASAFEPVASHQFSTRGLVGGLIGGLGVRCVIASKAGG